MKTTKLAAFAFALALSPSAYGADPAPALNAPDMVSWQLFAMVNAPAATRGNNNVLFETWATDDDTFTTSPQWPTAPLLAQLKIPALIRLAPRIPGLQPHVLPGGSEEVRRNKVSFDFVVQNNLYKQSGLAAAFASGKTISFPVDSVEVKANWVPVNTVNAALYHVNTASDGKQYALVSMHIISKTIPNWTWATFEHEDNPGRCDYMGCRDDFGATVPYVAPRTPLGGQYGACAKTQELTKIMTDANLADVFKHYCLKGSQTDFTTPTGVPILLGNSVTEDGFVSTSSCMTCHSRASVFSNGADAQGAGFLPNGQSPNGTPQPGWFYINPGQPNQKLQAFQTDFVWAIPLNAINQ
jgi:hypothetical protein